MKETEGKTPQKRRKQGWPKKWKPIHEMILTHLLQGKTQKQVGLELGKRDTYICHLTRWPVFARRFRLRRAAIVEASDAILAQADQMATVVLIEAMKFIKPQKVEVETKTGTKVKTIDSDPGLAVNAAKTVKSLNRERMQADSILNRLDKLESETVKE